MSEKKVRNEPWMRPIVPAHITLALKALSAGNANEGQQRTAVRWIIEDLCRANDLSYRPTSDRDTTFAEGKRFVGCIIREEITINPALLRSKKP